MTEFVQRRGVVDIAGRELATLGQGDRVLGQPVEGSVTRHVTDHGA
jgi:hypothetical protein